MILLVRTPGSRNSGLSPHLSVKIWTSKEIPTYLQPALSYMHEFSIQVNRSPELYYLGAVQNPVNQKVLDIIPPQKAQWGISK